MSFDPIPSGDPDEVPGRYDPDRGGEGDEEAPAEDDSDSPQQQPG